MAWKYNETSEVHRHPRCWMWSGGLCAAFTAFRHSWLCCDGSMHGRRKGRGKAPLWILKFSVKKGVFLVLSWKKFYHFCPPPRKNPSDAHGSLTLGQLTWWPPRLFVDHLNQGFPTWGTCTPRAVVANLWHACQRWHAQPSLWARAPSLQNRVRYQKGKGTRGQAAPKVGTATWKDTAKARRTSLSPSAQSGTFIQHVTSEIIPCGNITASYYTIFGNTILILDARLLWTFFASTNVEPEHQHASISNVSLYSYSIFNGKAYYLHQAKLNCGRGKQGSNLLNQGFQPFLPVGHISHSSSRAGHRT